MTTEAVATSHAHTGAAERIDDALTRESGKRIEILGCASDASVDGPSFLCFGVLWLSEIAAASCGTC